MNCKFHPTAEAVTTCAVCGAGMCSQCNTGAFFRVESGQPLCRECSFKEAEENVAFGERYLKGMKRKLIFSTFFIVSSVLLFLMEAHTTNPGNGMLLAIAFWFLSGLIQTWGHEKDRGSIKSILWEDSDGEGGSAFWKIIFYIFAGPVMLIRNFIKYPKLKASHQLDIQKYEEIKSALGTTN